MYGTLGGAVVYVVLRFFAVYMRSGCRLSVVGCRLFHPDLKELLSLMWPRMAALGALQAQLLLFDKVASGLDAGSVTINAYARNFQAVAVGVAGIALAQSAFSLLSQSAAQKEKKRYYIYLRKGILFMLIVTIPGAIALVMLAPIAASLVSLSHVLPVFSLCLLFYALSIPFESINHLLLRAFYATKHTITPAIFSVINGLSAIAAAWYLAPRFGVYSLAMGFAIGQGIQLIGLAVMLPRRVQKVM
jgi:putative peptidoglycan lipid II flippase